MLLKDDCTSWFTMLLKTSNTLMLLVLGFIFSLGMASCSTDDSDLLSNNNQSNSGNYKQLQSVIEELDNIPEYSYFTSRLKEVSNSISIDYSKLTVLAVKNKSANEPNLFMGDSAMHHHILQGNYDFSKMETDFLEVKNIEGEVLLVTKVADQVYVNNTLLISPTPIVAGQSCIYLLTEIVPNQTNGGAGEKKYRLFINVQECNTNWKSPSDKTSMPLQGLPISIFRFDGAQYIIISHIVSDSIGNAIYTHNLEEKIYYKLADSIPSKAHEDGMTLDTYKIVKQTTRGYLLNGVFSSQAEIDTYPEYRTGTDLDIIKPGNFKVEDKNKDGRIDKQDKLPEGYIFNEIDKEGNETVYVAIGTSNGIVFETNFINIEKMEILLASQYQAFNTVLKTNNHIDNQLMTGNVSYPSLYNIWDANTIWNSIYSSFRNFHYMRTELEREDYPKYIKEEWGKYSGNAWSQYAYLYTTLTERFGNIALVKEKWDLNETNYPTQSTKSEVIEYINELLAKVTESESYAIKAMLARLYANEKDYSKAYTLSREINSNGTYKLLANNTALNTASNTEVILGGYSTAQWNIEEITKGAYAHPIRYREVMLTLAESALELGKTQEAIDVLNQIYNANKQNLYTGAKNKDEITQAIRQIWETDMSNEGFDYMRLNRWDILVQTLGKYGAKDYNKLLPIPLREIELNPNFKQNPGY